MAAALDDGPYGECTECGASVRLGEWVPDDGALLCRDCDRPARPLTVMTPAAPPKMLCVTCNRWPAFGDGVECIACLNAAHYSQQRDMIAREGIAWGFVLFVALGIIAWVLWQMASQAMGRPG